MWLRVLLHSYEHTIYQIINTEHVSKPAISFPTTFSEVIRGQHFLQKLLLDRSSEGGSAQLQRTDVKNQDCYMQHQNRLRTMSSSPVLFSLSSSSFSLTICSFVLISSLWRLVLSPPLPPPSLKIMSLSCFSGRVHYKAIM